MKYTVTALIMGMGPWAQLVWLNQWIGLFGLVIQISGYVWASRIYRSGRWMKA